MLPILRRRRTSTTSPQERPAWWSPSPAPTCLRTKDTSAERPSTSTLAPGSTRDYGRATASRRFRAQTLSWWTPRQGPRGFASTRTLASAGRRTCSTTAPTFRRRARRRRPCHRCLRHPYSQPRATASPARMARASARPTGGAACARRARSYRPHLHLLMDPRCDWLTAHRTSKGASRSSTKASGAPCATIVDGPMATTATTATGAATTRRWSAVSLGCRAARTTSRPTLVRAPTCPSGSTTWHARDPRARWTAAQAMTGDLTTASTAKTWASRAPRHQRHPDAPYPVWRCPSPWCTLSSMIAARA